jgi:hypothetical protein
MLTMLAGRSPAARRELAEHLTITEVAGLAARIDWLRDTGRFPLPPEDWPAMPWPPM